MGTIISGRQRIYWWEYQYVTCGERTRNKHHVEDRVNKVDVVIGNSPPGWDIPCLEARRRSSSQDLRRSRRWEKVLRLKFLPVCIYVAVMLLPFCSTNWGYSKPRPGSGTTCAFSHVEWGKTHDADPNVHPGKALGPPPLPQVMNSFATNLCNAIQMTTITA